MICKKNVIFHLEHQYNKIMKKLCIFIIIISILCFAFAFCGCSTKQEDYAQISFYLSNQNGDPIKDATICFKKYKVTLMSNEDGCSEVAKLQLPQKGEDTWFGTIVTINAEGYVPVVIFNFILQYDQPRQASLMLLYDDGTLPYCAYVEVPDSESIRRILF